MEQSILEPATLEETRDLVAEAVLDGKTLEIMGAGSKRGLGRPVRAERVLSTRRLEGVDLYEPAELVMSAGVGTPMATIQATLAERGQELAFEPADYGVIFDHEPGVQTIGGVFAANLSGPRRLKVGAARDHLLGVTCVTGRGEVIRAGGRVVKNVTGYDLCKLLAGSHGTLAVMTRVIFKVLPRAETSATLLVRGADEQRLLAALRLAMNSSFEVSGAALLPILAAGRSKVAMLRKPVRLQAALRLEGPPPSVAHRIDALQQLLAEDGGLGFERLDANDTATLWAEIRDLKLLSPALPLWRLSMPPSVAATLSEWIGQMSAEHLYDWSGGLVWLALKPAWAGEADLIRRALADHGGHATLIRAAYEVRERVPVFEPQPLALAALTRRVKESFDPKHILNPGRMYAEV
ncbi:glycolate oxidase FAD binding subunit [Arboricoccus pini]|uniref:Glycolate oxidase FAD binding subunit n=1 Tax=Arboricoccus pini TaxID=1963835 RepID=A0A212RBT1_9PROT|nr:FAD-binding protein [Arboricoccus pini]SNB69672.1 glycolate oxidase FAD binding subunit [Arboricoccus pini]